MIEMIVMNGCLFMKNLLWFGPFSICAHIALEITCC